MELCCLVGGALALCMMVFRALRCSLMFLLLWILYLSVYKVGQVFLWFQWDSLLLESGFLTVLVAPFNLLFWRKPSPESHDGIPLWLVRWLLFRLMFASGVVKLTSHCPTWWGLTALNYHYETQCIPTPLAWYTHQLPDWIQKMSVVATYFIESVTPILFFLPVRSLRIFGFFAQVFLQVLIIATGNYNFFNLLTITLSFSLVDDRFLGYGSDEENGQFTRKLGPKTSLLLSAIKQLSMVSILALCLSLTVYYFSITFDLKNLAILSSTNFSKEGFAQFLSLAVPLFAIMAALSLVVEILSALLESISQPGLIWKVYALLKTALFSLVGVGMFSVSLVPYGVLDNNFHGSLPKSLMTLHDNLDSYSITSPYGLFRRMTGVEGRPEVIIEGTNADPEGKGWKEYEFLYKPGNVDAPPAYVAPHQPRLDWQMWFAALGGYSHNPWLVNLIHKLLVGEKDVLRLMAPPPFPSPPRYIRARLYHYHFTPYDTNASIVSQTRTWWQRELKSDYIYALTKDNTQLKEFLENHKYLSKPDVTSSESLVLSTLMYLREVSDTLSPPFILWSAFVTALVASLTLLLVCAEKKKYTEETGQAEMIEDYLTEIGTDCEDNKTGDTAKGKTGAHRRHRAARAKN